MTARARFSKVKTAEVKEGEDKSTKPKTVKKLSPDEYHDDQFEDDTPVKVPVKSIFVAVVLLITGTIFLTFGTLMMTGVIRQGMGSAFRAMPLMVIGSIIFIPGLYNVRTAFYVWRGYPGYSYADIAGFGEDQYYN